MNEPIRPRANEPCDGEAPCNDAMAVAAYRRENETLRSNCDHLSSENASLARHVEAMTMRFETMTAELEKPEDVRLREVLDVMEGRAEMFDSIAQRVGHILGELDAWIERCGAAERECDRLRVLVDWYDSRLTAMRVALTEAGVPESEAYPDEDVDDHERSLRAGGRVLGGVERIERLRQRAEAAEHAVSSAIARLHALSDRMDDHTYQELASALEAPPVPANEARHA